MLWSFYLPTSLPPFLPSLPLFPHTIKLTNLAILKSTIQGLLVQSQYYATTTMIYFQNISIIPKGNPVLINQSFSFPPPPSSWQPRIYLLSLWICLFWISYINRTVRYVPICAWLISLIVMPSRFTHVVICVRSSFLFNGCIIFRCMDRPHCVYSLIR